jgi:hypothetical protein
MVDYYRFINNFTGGKSWLLLVSGRKPFFGNLKLQRFASYQLNILK